MQTPRHLVAGTDFSSGAERAVETALALAAGRAFQVTLVHVCADGFDACDDRRIAQSAATLAELVAHHRQQRRLIVRGVLRSGTPWSKLDNVAVEVGASLIVIGRRGAGAAAPGALGSVAQRLVRTASRPVLIVPSDPDAFESEAQPNHPTTRNET